MAPVGYAPCHVSPGHGPGSPAPARARALSPALGLRRQPRARPRRLPARRPPPVALHSVARMSGIESRRSCDAGDSASLLRRHKLRRGFPRLHPNRIPRCIRREGRCSVHFYGTACLTAVMLHSFLSALSYTLAIVMRYVLLLSALSLTVVTVAQATVAADSRPLTRPAADP